MFTAKDMNKAINIAKAGLSDKVDAWLRDVVLPHKLSGNTSGFDCPDWIKPQELKELLQLRGFSVTTWSSYQGSFVSVDIPPQQGE